MADDDGWVVLDGVRKSDRTMRTLIGSQSFYLETAIPALVASEISTAVASIHPVEVNLQTHEFRFGRTILPIAEVTRAVLEVEALAQPRCLYLHFGVPGKLVMVAPISDGEKRPLDPSTRILLGNALERSSIEMPTSHYDPKGKFAHYNFPENVTRDEAVELLFNPPMPGEKLPIPE